MDKETKFGITLAVTALLVIGGVVFISKQSSEVTCPYCSEPFKTQAGMTVHKMGCEENPNDATMNTKGTGKVRNND